MRIASLAIDTASAISARATESSPERRPVVAAKSDEHVAEKPEKASVFVSMRRRSSLSVRSR